MKQGAHHRFGSGFTLIELLVVIAIIAILAVVVVLTLNPAELLRQSRDANRVSDAATLQSAIGLYSEDMGVNLGSSSVAYISVPDPSVTTAAGDSCWGLGLTAAASDTYQCAGSGYYHRVNGTGWIPINFASSSAGSPVSVLPTDPINTIAGGDYYTYETNGTQYEITMAFESQKYAPNAQNDGGQYPNLYEMGTSLKLAPKDFSSASSTSPARPGWIYFNIPVTIWGVPPPSSPSPPPQGRP